MTFNRFICTFGLARFFWDTSSHGSRAQTADFFQCQKASSKASKPTVDPAAQQGLMLAIAGVLGKQLQQLPVQSSACSAPDRPSYSQVLAIVKTKVQRWRQMELAGNEQCVEVQSESSDSCVFLKPESWLGQLAMERHCSLCRSFQQLGSQQDTLETLPSLGHCRWMGRCEAQLLSWIHERRNALNALFIVAPFVPLLSSKMI